MCVCVRACMRACTHMPGVCACVYMYVACMYACLHVCVPLSGLSRAEAVPPLLQRLIAEARTTETFGTINDRKLCVDVCDLQEDKFAPALHVPSNLHLHLPSSTVVIVPSVIKIQALTPPPFHMPSRAASSSLHVTAFLLSCTPCL